MHNYDVFYGQDKIGKASVEREGLYYHFRCQCDQPSDGIYYGILQTENRQFNLGVCIPENGRFCAYKRIPVKEFENENFKFCLITKDAKRKMLVAVDKDKPFGYLQDLESASLNHSGEEIQIALNGTKYLNQDQQDNDQSQEFQHQS